MLTAGIARTPGDVRMIVGQGTFAHASAAFKGNNSDESGVERLQEKSGGLMVSAHVPDVASSKQNALIRLGMDRGAATFSQFGKGSVPGN